MQNLLILYNPYYQKDVIKQHLEILVNKGEVAFGKVESKLKETGGEIELDKNQKLNNELLQEICENISPSNPVQLFLSDYANLFVAKVIKVSKEVDENIIPKYYQEKNLKVEDYFIISDLRELVREDFTLLRDKFLANFITPNKHTYAIYGNNYIYPLVVEQKEEINYFYDIENKYCLSVYKSQEYLKMQENFIQFVFGKRLFFTLHPDSINNLVLAELELEKNLENPLYDFTPVIVRYSKALEYEVYDFARKLLRVLSLQNEWIQCIGYSMQGREYSIKDFLEDITNTKINMGSIKFLLRNQQIQEVTSKSCQKFIRYEFQGALDEFAKIRNEAVHAKIPSLEQTLRVRSIVLGIENVSVLKGVLREKLEIRSR